MEKKSHILKLVYDRDHPNLKLTEGVTNKEVRKYLQAGKRT